MSLEEQMVELEKRALQFVTDNWDNPTEVAVVVISSAMKIGYSLALEHQAQEVNAETKAVLEAAFCLQNKAAVDMHRHTNPNGTFQA